MNRSLPPVVALEGPVRAGKTTLLRKARDRYSSRIVTIREYGNYSGGSSEWPAFPPHTVEETIGAARFFMELEERRKADLEMEIRGNPPCELVLTDRSWHTCLAFDLAAQPLAALPALEVIREEWESRRKIVPDLIIYLDICDSQLQERLAPFRASYRPVLYDSAFNERFRGYFLHDLALHSYEGRLIRIDANRTMAEVQDDVFKVIEELLGTAS